MSGDKPTDRDGVPRVVRPDDDTAPLLVLTRPRLLALARRLCVERNERAPLDAALEAMSDDELITLVRRLRALTG